MTASGRSCASTAARPRPSAAGGHDWTHKYQRIIDTCAKLSCGSALIDGEVVVQNEDGVSNFAALRAAIDREPHRLVFFAFDLSFFNGQDWRREPLSQRPSRLEGLMPNDPTSAIQFSEHFDGEGAQIFKKACAMGLEGIVSKRAAHAFSHHALQQMLKYLRKTVEGYQR
jgi:bifunctional non-homologous end joining protein LigD